MSKRNPTKITVKGANIAPILPIMEHEFIIVVRRLVGHCSAVKIYSTANAPAIAALASINNTSTIIEFSCGIHGVTIVAIAVSANAANINILRLMRFSNGNVINILGISRDATIKKLVYRFSPGTCVEINPIP